MTPVLANMSRLSFGPYKFIFLKSVLEKFSVF